MRNERECKYVVLGYAGSALAETASPIAICAVHARSEVEQSLTVRIVPLMPTEMTTNYREYLFELFESWMRTPMLGLDGLFRELRDLSTGQLRACSTGYCANADLPGIADKTLGANHELRDRT